MYRKIIKIYIVLFVILQANIAFSSDFSMLWDYFHKRGFLVRTRASYESGKQLSDLDKAAMLTEIMEKIHKSSSGYDLADDILSDLQKALYVYYDDIQIFSDISTEIYLKKIDELMLSNQKRNISAYNREYEVQKTPSDVITADEILKRRTARAPKEYNVYPEFTRGQNIPANTSPVYKLTEVKKQPVTRTDISKKSYFAIGAGSYQPSKTSFGYVESEPFYTFSFGYQRSSKAGFDFRKMFYKSSSTGNFFGVAGSDYELKIEPLSVSLKFSPIIYKKIMPYSGYGISRIEIVHTLNEPGQNTRETKEVIYSPFAYYGIEYHEKQDFSAYFEVSTNLSNSKFLNIKNKLYEIDAQNYIWSFGIKFYFD
ncbi:MAG: hypothetical protein WC337_06235 [Candidatus Muiribacteriota bacterium]